METCGPGFELRKVFAEPAILRDDSEAPNLRIIEVGRFVIHGSLSGFENPESFIRVYSPRFVGCFNVDCCRQFFELLHDGAGKCDRPRKTPDESGESIELPEYIRVGVVGEERIL